MGTFHAVADDEVAGRQARQYLRLAGAALADLDLATGYLCVAVLVDDQHVMALAFRDQCGFGNHQGLARMEGDGDFHQHAGTQLALRVVDQSAYRHAAADWIDPGADGGDLALESGFREGSAGGGQRHAGFQ